jgi:hypothetical protein
MVATQIVAEARTGGGEVVARALVLREAERVGRI